MRWASLLAAFVLCTLALPGAGSARIRLYQGIGKLRLGMTSAQVMHAIGKPDSVDPDVSGKKGPQFRGFVGDPSYRLWQYYARSRYSVGLAKRAGKLRVVMIGYSLRGQMTSSGVGVGSTYSLLRLKYRQIRCTPLGDPQANTDDCVLRSPRGRETVFEVNKYRFLVQAIFIRDRV